ncbi:MAG: hypothetical protein ACRDPW_02440 [Mycobacteriales bacterium]
MTNPGGDIPDSIPPIDALRAVLEVVGNQERERLSQGSTGGRPPGVSEAILTQVKEILASPDILKYVIGLAYKGSESTTPMVAGGGSDAQGHGIPRSNAALVVEFGNRPSGAAPAAPDEPLTVVADPLETASGAVRAVAGDGSSPHERRAVLALPAGEGNRVTLEIIEQAQAAGRPVTVEVGNLGEIDSDGWRALIHKVGKQNQPSRGDAAQPPGVAQSDSEVPTPGAVNFVLTGSVEDKQRLQEELVAQGVDSSQIRWSELKAWGGLAAVGKVVRAAARAGAALLPARRTRRGAAAALGSSVLRRRR